VALPHLKQLTDIPIIGVINPGSEEAVRNTKNKRIGVIGTEGTIRSAAYTAAIKALCPDAEVFSQACPLFVPIVEEGWQNHDIAWQIANEYLLPMKEMDIDTLVLGCTHYPLLSDTITKVMGPSVRLVDSAQAIAEYLKSMIPDEHDGIKGKDTYYVSDNENKFTQIASQILQTPIHGLRRVRLFESWSID
jgi:glutamate racemase